jgi:hypothetical protein
MFCYALAMTAIAAEVLKAEGKCARIGRTITPPERRAELIRGYRPSGQAIAQFPQCERVRAGAATCWLFASLYVG